MVEKRLFIKSDIQLLFWIRSSCTMEGHGVHILLRQVHLRCQFDRKFYTSFFFLLFLQTPSVESDSNFISSDQMSIVKKEFGEHTYTVFYVYIYIYTCLKEGIFRVCRGSLIFTTTFGLAPLRERHKKSECFVTTWSLFTERARASRLIASRPSEIVDLHYLFLSKIVMTWRSLTQVVQNIYVSSFFWSWMLTF